MVTSGQAEVVGGIVAMVILGDWAESVTMEMGPECISEVVADS